MPAGYAVREGKKMKNWDVTIPNEIVLLVKGEGQASYVDFSGWNTDRITE